MVWIILIFFIIPGMRGEIAKLCLVIATLTLGTVSSDGACERGRTWWHRQRGSCIPCTRCDPHRLVVKYPCELHRDTICQPLYEVRIWPFNTEKDNDASETSSDYEYYEDTDYSGEVSDDIEWDIQTSTLTLAVSGCIVFFVVVVTLSLYHAKQWRVLKQTLKSGTCKTMDYDSTCNISLLGIRLTLHCGEELDLNRPRSCAPFCFTTRPCCYNNKML